MSLKAKANSDRVYILAALPNRDQSETRTPTRSQNWPKSEINNSLYDIPSNISINHSSSSSIVTPASRSQSSAVSKQSAVPKHDWAVQTFSSPTQCMQVSISAFEIIFAIKGSTNDSIQSTFSDPKYKLDWFKLSVDPVCY